VAWRCQNKKQTRGGWSTEGKMSASFALLCLTFKTKKCVCECVYVCVCLTLTLNHTFYCPAAPATPLLPLNFSFLSCRNKNREGERKKMSEEIDRHADILEQEEKKFSGSLVCTTSFVPL
jgi:hypothetical protein